MAGFLHLNGVTYGLPGVETPGAIASVIEQLMPQAPAAAAAGGIGSVPQRIEVELGGHEFELHVRRADVKTVGAWLAPGDGPFGDGASTPTVW